MALPRAAASRVDSWFGSDAVDKRTTTFAGTPRPTLSALPRKRRYPNRLHALLRLLRDAADLSLSIPMRTLRHRLHWSARIRCAVRRLRRTALGGTAPVLVFSVLVFKQEASVRVHAVLPLHTVLPGPEPGWLCDQPGRDQSWRPSPALLCQAPARRGAVASGTAAPPRRDAAIVHRRTGDLSLRLRRQRRRRPPRRRPPRCPVRAAASSRGERG